MFALEFNGIRPKFGAKIIDYGPAQYGKSRGPTSLLGPIPLGPDGKHIVCNPAPKGKTAFEKYVIRCGEVGSSDFSLQLLKAKSEHQMVAFVSQYGFPFHQSDSNEAPNTSFELSRAMKTNDRMPYIASTPIYKH